VRVGLCGFYFCDRLGVRLGFYFVSLKEKYY
jgi:hypothetical protein